MSGDPNSQMVSSGRAKHLGDLAERHLDLLVILACRRWAYLAWQRISGRRNIHTRTFRSQDPEDDACRDSRAELYRIASRMLQVARSGRLVGI
jgi:hypothetical protein